MSIMCASVLVRACVSYLDLTLLDINHIFSLGNLPRMMRKMEVVVEETVKC